MDDIQVISAASILGLKPTGVEKLADSLLDAGLANKLPSPHPVINVPTLNFLYDNKRDRETNCLNIKPLRNFLLTLSKAISGTMDKGHFAFVLGGDCSILIGIMAALKTKGDYGVIFMDAHADFYEPEKSITGEVADMDLAIITGRGPQILTNINNMRPYVKDENVLHIGQRDWEETKKYGSQDIRETGIKCISLSDIEKNGIENTSLQVLEHIHQMQAGKFWIHFDTDVLSDEINPAVDYRLPAGLSFKQSEFLVKKLLLTDRVVGISVTIFNPTLDKDGSIAKDITASLGRSFDLNGG